MPGRFIMAVLQIRSLRNFSVPDCGSHITYWSRKRDYTLPSKAGVVLVFKDTISYTNMQIIGTHNI